MASMSGSSVLTKLQFTISADIMQRACRNLTDFKAELWDKSYDADGTELFGCLLLDKPSATESIQVYVTGNTLLLNYRIHCY